MFLERIGETEDSVAEAAEMFSGVAQRIVNYVEGLVQGSIHLGDE